MSSMEDRIAARRKNFKKAVDPEEARRKREDEAIQLRKQKKEDMLQKKRMVTEEAPGGMAQVAQTSIPPEQFQLMVQALYGADPQAVFNSTQQFRKLLSIENNPPIQDVINAQVVPQFIALLKDTTRPELQFEAAWVLTNIASGSQDQTRVVVEQGATPIFVELLRSPSDDVREQAVWALGNIAGDSPVFRDQVLASGGLEPLRTILETSEKTSMMRNATWTLSNLCRGKPAPDFAWVRPSLTTLANLISSSDLEVLTDACWALSYLSDGDNDRITAVINSGVVQRLVDLLAHASELVQTPALRAVGNIVTGDDKQTDVAIRCGCLTALLALLSHRKKAIRKETCWTISNITAGNKEQIQEVINVGLIPPVIDLLSNAEFDIKKEAAWAISNATNGGLFPQVEYLVHCGCVKPLCEMLGCSDNKMIIVALDALDNILKQGETKQKETGLEANPYCQLVEEADGLSKMEQLQQECNDEIYKKAIHVMSKYWVMEDDDDAAFGNMDQAIEQPAGGFNFGA